MPIRHKWRFNLSLTCLACITVVGSWPIQKYVHSACSSRRKHTAPAYNNFEGIAKSRWRTLSPDELQHHHEQLFEMGFTIIREILTLSGLDEINQHVSFDETHGATQGYRKHGSRDSKVIKSFHENLAEILARVLGPKNLPTYAFAMEYDENSFLPPHLELVTNEISSTLCFYREGDYDLNIDRRRFENKYDGRYTASETWTVPDREVERIGLRLGDLGIFNGRNHFHWRDAQNISSFRWRGILFHFMQNYTVEDRLEQISWGTPEKENYMSNARYQNEGWKIPIVARDDFPESQGAMNES